MLQFLLCDDFMFAICLNDFQICYSMVCSILDCLRSAERLIWQAASEWLYVVPWGIRKLINYVAKRYNNPPIYVTENGKELWILLSNMWFSTWFITHPKY